MLKFFKRLIIALFLLYIAACSYMFFMQEDFIFHPKKLAAKYKINFPFEEEELMLKIDEKTSISAILCHSQQKKKKGLIFFLHGNSGNLTNQEQPAQFYTDMGYDFFSMDYRTFGKSTGELIDEKQFYSDITFAYKTMTKRYAEDSIIVVGYSIGTGSAAMITASQHPSKLILIAPYYSLIDMTQRRYPFIPSFLLNYKFETNEFLKKIDQPVLIVHGNKDDILPFEGSVMLSELLNEKSRFVAINGQNHNDFEFNKTYISALKKFLN